MSLINSKSSSELEVENVDDVVKIKFIEDFEELIKHLVWCLGLVVCFQR